MKNVVNHKLIPVLVLGALVCASDSFAQTRRGGPSARSNRSNTTGFGVGINIPLSNNDPATNPSQKPLLIIATCNATSVIKNVEGWVGSNNPATVQDMVASQTGNHRTAITFQVPWGWYYRVNVSYNTVGSNGAIQNDETVGMAANMSCKATAWWAE